MVRTKAKKDKGDDAFEKRKQKVGRKKLEPATSTRAEVTARGLRVGVAKTIVDQQRRQQEQSASAAAAEDSATEQQQEIFARKHAVPDIATILVSITHYRAGSRATSLKQGVQWVTAGRTAQQSPALTVQLLHASLATLPDVDDATRDAAAAVVTAIARRVLGPCSLWPAVAESVADRLNIALTHASFGVRSTAAHLLAELCDEDEAAAALKKISNSSNSTDGSDDASTLLTLAPRVMPTFISYLIGCRTVAADAALDTMIRNTVIVVKSKAQTFPVLPPILQAAFGTSNRNNGPGEPSSSSSFALRQPSLVVDTLRDVWEFGTVRVKEVFESGVALLRNEQGMRLVTSVLDSTAILTAAAAAISSNSNNNNNNNNNNSNVLGFIELPGRVFFSSILHMCTDRVPFSLHDMCGATSTTPRKAALATSLGRVYLAMSKLPSSSRRTGGGTDSSLADIVRGAVKPLHDLIALGFDMVSSSSSSSTMMTEIPELACFCFRAVAELNQQSLQQQNQQQEDDATTTSSSQGDGTIFTTKMLKSLPLWIDVVLRTLQSATSTNINLDHFTDIVNNQLLVVVQATMKVPACLDQRLTHSQDAIAHTWGKLVQFLFMLRSLVVNNNNGEAQQQLQHQQVTAAVLRIARRVLELLYEFTSTGCRTFFAAPAASAADSQQQESMKKRWTPILLSLSSVVAMQKGRVAAQQGGEQDGDEEWVLGTILSAPCDMQTATIIDPETRSLCFGVLHYAAVCLRQIDNGNTAVPASWKAIAESAKLRATIKSSLPSSERYLRLLDLVF